jgi:AcrR family transcriptional regulator
VPDDESSNVDGALPPTTKGRATRRRIEDGLRTLLAERPYSSVRISDIAERAGLSPGAVYRYFPDRREILLTVLRELTDEAFAFVHSPWDPQVPERSVRETTIRYFHFYEHNRALFAVMAELAQSDSDVRDIWQQSQRAFHARIEHALERAVEQGVVRSDIEPDLAAQLLGGMAEFYAYRRFVIGFADAKPDVETAAEVLTELWSRGTLTDRRPLKKRK